MKVILNVNQAKPPFGGIIAANYVKTLGYPIQVCWTNNGQIIIEANSKKEIITCNTSNEILRWLGRDALGNLYGSTPLERTEIDHWLTFSLKLATGSKSDFSDAIKHLDKFLGPVTYLSHKRFTLADFSVFGALFGNKYWRDIFNKNQVPANVTRWYNFLLAQECVKNFVNDMPDSVNESLKAAASNRRSSIEKPAATTRAREGKYVDLPGAEMGKVVVRFPPEASGYLHIGHAKAALLNEYYQQEFKGKLILRFDDTNPAKEDLHFEQVILEDVALLEIKPDMFTHTSQYFDLMLEYCEKMIKEGKAYVDDTDAELMKQQREQKIESVNRNNSVEKNLQLWSEMKSGTEQGQKCCVRAKIDMQSPNGCMRDPTIYRCKNEPHPKTGTKYKVYPTYDFACPIVDAIEGVTHTLRTMEYHDRDDQFYWFIDVLGLRKPYIWEYSKLSMQNAVLSKRKLTWFVQQGLVDGWDDPRMPTVRGVLRRGMTVQGLKDFIIAQGSSKHNVSMEWDKIWAFNKKVIDPIAPRYTAVSTDNVTVHVKGVKEECLTVPRHPKNQEVGTKSVWVGPNLIIDRADAECLKEGENATFINWGNILIKKINRENGKITSIEAEPNLDNKDYKKTLKLTFLAATPKAEFIPTYCVYFDHLISKPLKNDEDFKQYIGHETRKEVQVIGDPELKNLKKGDIIQLQRRDFCRVDVAYEPASVFSCREQPIILFCIPDGSSKPNPIFSSTSEITQDKKQSQKSATNDNKKDKAAGDASTLNQRITDQGNLIRDLKSQKVEKSVVDKEVKVLLDLKNQYKSLTGVDWKPGTHSVTNKPETASASQNDKTDNAVVLNQKIIDQGNVVRNLKTQKAEKSAVDKEVKVLLDLKGEYKALTGADWKPGIQPPLNKTESSSGSLKVDGPSSDNIVVLNQKIMEQGNNVRNLKAQKAEKSAVDKEVKVLLDLKSQYKTLTGTEWKPGIQVPVKMEPSSVKNDNCSVSDDSVTTLNQSITDQGNVIRNLKAQKAEKSAIDKEVKTLLDLKKQYKTLTGTEWKPVTQVTAVIQPHSVQNNDSSVFDDAAATLNQSIIDQGNVIRNLKTQKAEKSAIDKEVRVLLDLKAQYKASTGIEWKPPTEVKIEKSTKQKKEKSPQPKAEKKSAKQGVGDCKKPAAVKEETSKNGQGDKPVLKKQTRLCLEFKKEENFAKWYSEIITKGRMCDYYDISGCYVIEPRAMFIWETIVQYFNNAIKKLGVRSVYFPMFVSKNILEKEKTHLTDFAPEVAWVTKAGDSELAEHIAIRPTSETVMYPKFAKWIQSYKDLPIKVNQWSNVVRWEFKHPQPFLRTREFLWQEGHTAYAVQAEAMKEVEIILDYYAKIYTELLAIPVVKGRKTTKEAFAGADYTLTVEAYISSSGRAIQGATSHHLGQNFSKMFDIIYEDPITKEKRYVYQNSWGITTRTIGVMIMVHSDNKGLVIPPKVAEDQVVIVPCGITTDLSADIKAKLLDECKKLEEEIRAEGLRVQGDYREDQSPGWKFNDWELKGVPVRIELGPKDLEKKQIVAVRRDESLKLTIPRNKAVEEVKDLLDKIQTNLLEKATHELNTHIVCVDEWSDFISKLEEKNLILTPFCGEVNCEEEIKTKSKRDEDLDPGAPSMGAKSLCIPTENPKAIKDTDHCINPSCKKKPLYYTLFGRSY